MMQYGLLQYFVPVAAVVVVSILSYPRAFPKLHCPRDALLQHFVVVVVAVAVVVLRSVPAPVEGTQVSSPRGSGLFPVLPVVSVDTLSVRNSLW